MSKEARDWYLRQKIADGHMKNVLSQLAYLHYPGKDLFPSQKTIAEMAGISPRTVWAALRLLDHCGVIKRTARSAPNKGRISDLIELQISETFNLNRRIIGDARVALGLAPTVPKHWHRSHRPPRKDCETPSQALRTNRGSIDPPYQEGISPEGEISTRGAPSAATPWRGFKVIAGGRK